MATSGSVSAGQERVHLTDKEKLALYVGHHEAIRDMKYEFDSEGYWKHIAVKVGKSVEAVQEYWKNQTTYMKYSQRFQFHNPKTDVGVPPKGEEKEKKAEEGDDDTTEDGWVWV